MTAQTVARRYASAMADVIGGKQDQDQVVGELRTWDHMMQENPPLQEAFLNPTIPQDAKRRLLEDLIKRMNMLQTTANFLRLLLKNQRLSEISVINQKLSEVLDERAGIVSAAVTSARPLPAPAKRALENKLSEISRKSIRLTFDTDESLIGGMITRVGSIIYDGSLRTQLRQLAEELAGK